MQISAIAAVDRNWAIGFQNKLLMSIPADMKFFREKTKGHVVVMGRKTLESFPGGNPLKNRTNIVLTGNPGYRKEGVVTVHSQEELEEALQPFSEEEVFIIGGGSVYRMLLPLCDTAYITKMDREFQADTAFPDLDADPGWEITERSEEQDYEGLKYRFLTYRRRKLDSACKIRSKGSLWINKRNMCASQD